MADAKLITRLLLKAYPDPTIALRFSNPLELLIATILSAQCTDARVNEVTRSLFRRYRTAEDYAKARPDTLEREIRPTGFYKNKARLIIRCCQKLVEEYGGEVPQSLEALTSLPGVGRKTANLVRGCAFGQQAIAVDTHVKRVSRRLGIARAEDPDKIEEELMAQVPRNRWTPFTLAMIRHGREVCTARRPACPRCPLRDACDWPDKTVETARERNQPRPRRSSIR